MESILVNLKCYQILSDGSIASMNFGSNLPKGFVAFVHYDFKGEPVSIYYFRSNFSFSIEKDKILSIYNLRKEIFKKEFEGSILPFK